jgi:hypothetical protein
MAPVGEQREYGSVEELEPVQREDRTGCKHDHGETHRARVRNFFLKK